MSKSLQERAMLVGLNIRQWNSYKYDSAISAELTDRYGTSRNSARVNKNLIPFACPLFEAIDTAAGQLRRTFYRNTLQWQEGWRIVSAARYFDFRVEIKTDIDSFYAAVAAFLPHYNEIHDKARRELNGMYKPSDWPLPFEIEHKFRAKISKMPLPSADDFRVQISDSEREAIRADIEADIQENLRGSVRSLWSQLHDAVAEFGDKLDQGSKLRQASFERLTGLCRTLGQLNEIGCVPEFDDMRSRVEVALLGLTPKDVNKDGSLQRAQLTAEIAQITNDLSEWI